MRGEAGGANTGDYVDARHSSDPKEKRPGGRFVMKQVAGYGGMCRQSSTLKADERSADRVDRDFDGGCGCRPNRPPRASQQEKAAEAGGFIRQGAGTESASAATLVRDYGKAE